MSLCGILNPFKWEHVLIPIVPNFLSDILEAPVPYIVGLNKSEEEFSKEILLPGPASTAIIVKLDSGEICGDLSAKIDFYSLKNALNLLSSEYNLFKQKIILSDLSEKSHQICIKIKEILKSAILNYLPVLTVIPKNTKTMGGLEAVKQSILKSVKEKDKDFIGKFLETQMFTTYIEDRYLVPIKHEISP